MNRLTRSRWMLAIVAFGLFVSGVTVWPLVPEIKLVIHLFWGDAPVTDSLHGFLAEAVNSLEAAAENQPFLLYGFDWLAFAHIVLAVLFASAIRDPVRNIWVVQCGLIMCLLVPVLAGICVPLRGLPWPWFFIDAVFAPVVA